MLAGKKKQTINQCFCDPYELEKLFFFCDFNPSLTQLTQLLK